MTEPITTTLRRAKGSAQFSKVMLGHMDAETACLRAADVIEGLEAALRAVATWSDGPGGSTTAERSMRRIAKQGLEGKAMINTGQPLEIHVDMGEEFKQIEAQIDALTPSDIYTLDKPLGEYNDATIGALLLHQRFGGRIEYKGQGGWNSVQIPSFDFLATYRAVRPVIEDVIPWAAVADRFRWYARCGIGECFFFENRPDAQDDYWNRNNGETARAEHFAGHNPGNTPWQESLRERPEGM